MKHAGLVNVRPAEIELYITALLRQSEFMIMGRKIFPFMALVLIAAGCTNATLTNLTPQQQQRNGNGFYPVEVALETRKQTLRWNSIKPMVKVGADYYPMRPTPLMATRWEGLIPVPAGANIVKYNYKFDYQYNAMGKPRNDSALSKTYTLKILDK